MCGITGILPANKDAPIDRQLLTDMTERLAHRGPDGDGLYIQPGIGLGHRRLAIIDLAGGAQPMATDDNSLVLTFNGEIYNFQSIRRELEGKGVHFATQSDTEVLLKAYGYWGGRLCSPTSRHVCLCDLGQARTSAFSCA